MSDVDNNVPQQETSAEVDDFDSAFAEFSGETPDVPVEDEQETPVEVAEETPEVTEVTETSETEQTESDPFAGLSEQQKQYFAELQKKASEADHTIKSQIGRVSALQKKINDLESSKAAPKSAPEVRKPSNPVWEAAKSEYPTIFEPMEQELAEIRQMVSEQVGQATQPIRELQHERYISHQFAALEAAHPDYKDVVATDTFRSWLSAQPPQIQAFAASEDANEASYLLSTFKAITGSKPREVSQVAEIKEQRKAKLEAATGIQSKGATNPSVGGAPDDFDAAFEFFSRKGRRA
jgi:hypothetical protein